MTGIAGALTCGRWLLAAVTALRQPGPGRFEDAVTAGAAVIAVPLLVWLTVAVTITAAATARPPRPGERRPGGLQRASNRITPPALRRTVAVLVGATVVGLGAPALAQADPGLDPGWPGRPAVVQVEGQRPAGPSSVRLTVPGSTVAARPSEAAVPTATLDPGWVPERPPPSRPVAPPPGAAGRGSLLVDPEVVVHRGDTLWDIAARRLGPIASDAQIAAEWPRWYAANRAAIGPDPDRLRPGQRLRAPEPAAAADQNRPHEERIRR